VLSTKALPAYGGEENPPALKQFVRRVGSNVLLGNRTLSLTYNSPFGLVAQTGVERKWRALADVIRQSPFFFAPLLRAALTRIQGRRFVGELRRTGSSKPHRRYSSLQGEEEPFHTSSPTTLPLFE